MNHPSKVLRVIITIAKHPDEKTGKTHFEAALPFLQEAVDGFDPGDERSIDDATVACDALGQAKDKDSVATLINAAQKAMPKLSPANRVRIAAVKALGQFKDPRAVDVLIKVLSADPEQQRVQLHAAAALALAETGDPKALPELTKALFIGPISSFVRRAISRVGRPAVPAMIALYQEKDPAILKMAEEKKWKEKAPGTMVYMGALVLGDLHAREAAKMLVDGLKAAPRVSYYDKNGAPGPSTHMAILEALQYIGDPATAAPLYQFALDKATDDGVRPRAIDVYSWVATDTAALPQLLSYISDPDTEYDLKMVSIIAYGRIARTDADARPIDAMIRTWEGKVKAAEEKGKAAKTPLDKNAAEGERAQADGMKSTLQDTRYRIDIAIQCKQDAMCYVKAIGEKDVAVGKPGLPKAERALIELYKMGDKAKPALDPLLKFADSSERMIRQGVNLALPRVAPKPCKPCADRLHQVIENQASQTTLDALNAETRIVYHYFLWAGT